MVWHKPLAHMFSKVCRSLSPHRGRRAVDYIRQRIDQLPSVRPLVLILKQSLKDRGLSESYSGGLSSYALCLMVIRFLEEQSNQMDMGALLMGFLSFYGLSFDARTTGISVHRCCYFNRLTAGFDYASASGGSVCQFGSSPSHRPNPCYSEKLSRLTRRRPPSVHNRPTVRGRPALQG